MSTSVVYARVPDGVKDAVDDFAASQGTTLTRAVVELLERGLAAAADEGSVKTLETKLARVTAEKDQLEAEVQGLKAEQAALRALSQRVGQPVGKCPNPRCGKAISGYDLFAVGQCPACKSSLTALIAPPARSSTLNEREFMMLVGALGAVVGVALFVAAAK